MDVTQTPLTRQAAGVVPGSRLDYALRYVAAGFKVLPLYHIVDGRCSCGDPECRSPGKHPLVVREAHMFGGVHSATNDEHVLRQVFAANPDANIGLAIPDGMAAIDVDPRNGGEDTIDALQAQCGKLPDTAMQLTGGGGQHYLYRVPAGVKLVGRLGPGVDVKGAGGYIVAEPSTHTSGTAYVWEASSDPLAGAEIASAPTWLINRLVAGETSAPTVPGTVYAVPEKTLDELRQALYFVDPDDRNTWIRMGQALKTLGEPGFALWDEYSQRSTKYDATDQRKRWDGFAATQTSYRAVFVEAQRGGWLNPLSRGAAPVGGAVPAAQPARGGFRFDDVAELVADIKPIQWLVRDYIEQDSLVLIYGPPGSAKSFAAVDFAACVATGHPWQGHAIQKPGPVFYLAGEGHNGLARRFRAWEVAHDTQIPKGMLWKSSSAAQMLVEESVIAVADAIWELSGKGERPPALIVIDTLARNFGPGDENSTADMSAFIAAVDKYLIQPWRCAVIIVHHSGHNQDRARGSSALKAAVDAEHEITRDEAGNIQLRTTKMKDAEIPGEKLLRLRGVELPGVFDEDGAIVTSAVLEPCEDAVMSTVVGARPDKTPILARDVLTFLARGWVPYSELARNIDTSKTQATRICKKLEGLGLLEARGGEYAVTDRAMQALSQTGALLVASAPQPARRNPRPWMDTDDKDDE